jgi:hypothetical protein
MPRQKEGARTQHAPTRGTAKRLGEKHAEPRPIGRVLSAALSWDENSRFSRETEPTTTQNWIVLHNKTDAAMIGRVRGIAKRKGLWLEHQGVPAARLGRPL